MPSRVIGFFAEQTVSPVLMPASFVTTPMSPAGMQDASSCLLPLRVIILPILSLSSVRELYAGVSGVILPETTLKKDILPTNGSAMVLKQIAASGPFSSQGRPFSPALSAAEGAE